ncbi:hypothetical protein RCL_jg23620.t1 [Rhizophagus clarus]|uniref:Uncharacterized protein n=1 Tax=Rhizophagus clarus TaxID=94130 RepID=A0A8H3L5U9_9GLOM|nr:hypothetical protein RCL_jg23620.t1 [Rhizophagus clarus]
MEGMRNKRIRQYGVKEKVGKVLIYKFQSYLFYGNSFRQKLLPQKYDRDSNPFLAFAVAHPCGIYTSILLYQLFPYIDRYEVVRRLYRNSLIESFSSMPLKRDLHRQRQRINKIFIYFESFFSIPNELFVDDVSELIIYFGRRD